ncbi:MAG: hypothetical protein IT292_06165 [Deltaproteobacteria bacterium]|nr:hypothetical protein [Deltaproteobacteria bacterium]
MKDKKKEKPDEKSKSGGIAFLISIILLYIIGCVSIIAVILILSVMGALEYTWFRFFVGFATGLVIFSFSGLDGFRTFLHEAKHAVMVIISGNSLKEFHASEHSGHVTYELQEDNLQSAPWITLAPYCLPLFSLPLFIICLFVSDKNHPLFTILLAAALGIDFTTGLHEIHISQTDLKRIYGGIMISASFIGAMFFSWFSFCLLWIIAGNHGVLIFFQLFMEMIASLFTRIWGD